MFTDPIKTTTHFAINPHLSLCSLFTRAPPSRWCLDRAKTLISDHVTSIMPPHSTTTLKSSPSLPPAPRIFVKGPRTGRGPIKQKCGRYSSSSREKPLKHYLDAKRYMNTTAGMPVTCKYCDKPSSGRSDCKLRHLRSNRKCLEIWKAGYETGRFTIRSVEDAYNQGHYGCRPLLVG